MRHSLSEGSELPSGHDFIAARIGRLVALLTLLVTALLAVPLEPASAAGRGQGPFFTAASDLPKALVPRPLSVVDGLARLPDDGSGGSGGDHPAGLSAGGTDLAPASRVRLAHPRATATGGAALSAGCHYSPRAPPLA